MTPEPGLILLHYQLVEKIGDGGMGVVWEALDTELQRHVALKILPGELTHDEERRLRFQREARTAAALSHAGIAVVHGVEESDGVHFLAMEYVQGVTLREHVATSRGDLREGIRLALQIAEGLAHAHSNGVVHRDLKPDNVMVAPEGQVKFLDFGLAKVLEPRAEGVGDSRAETETALDTISRETREAKHDEMRRRTARPTCLLGGPSPVLPEGSRGALPRDGRATAGAHRQQRSSEAP